MLSVLFGTVMVLHLQANREINDNILKTEIAVNQMYDEDKANSIWWLNRQSLWAKPVITQKSYYDPETNTIHVV
jgi:hypothetical protein